MYTSTTCTHRTKTRNGTWRFGEGTNSRASRYDSSDAPFTTARTCAGDDPGSVKASWESGPRQTSFCNRIVQQCSPPINSHLHYLYTTVHPSHGGVAPRRANLVWPKRHKIVFSTAEYDPRAMNKPINPTRIPTWLGKNSVEKHLCFAGMTQIFMWKKGV